MISNRLFVAAATVALLTAGAASAQTPAPAAAPAMAQPDPNAAAAMPTGPKPWSAPAAMGRVNTPYSRIAPSGDMIATLQASGQFTTLLKVLDATGLTAVVKQQQNLTLFAPTDAGFASLPAGKLDELMQNANIAKLQQIMTYHLVNTRVDSTKLNGSRGPVPTAASANIYVDGTWTPIKVNQAYIVQADIATSNGLIHVVSAPLSSQFAPPPLPMEETAPAEQPPAAPTPQAPASH